MITRINPGKAYPSVTSSMQDVLDAIAGDWGSSVQGGLRIINIGKATILQGVYGNDVEAVDIPVLLTRFPAYFHDTKGHSCMSIVEAGEKFVKRPKNIVGGFSFFAIV